MAALHDIGSSAPSFDALPRLTKLGGNAPNIPAASVVYRIGTAVPNVPSPRLALWDLGPDIARDAEDEAVETDLRWAVERETIRRQEVASAKPLDPFGATPGARLHSDFEELLALLQKRPDLLVVHEGQIFPGEALSARLRKALHDYALHPRARAAMINTVKEAQNGVTGEEPARSPTSTAVQAANVQAARDAGYR